MTEEEAKQFEDLCKPLVNWLNEHGNPHSKIIIETDGAELVSGSYGFTDETFIRY